MSDAVQQVQLRSERHATWSGFLKKPCTWHTQ